MENWQHQRIHLCLFVGVYPSDAYPLEMDAVGSSSFVAGSLEWKAARLSRVMAVPATVAVAEIHIPVVAVVAAEEAYYDSDIASGNNYCSCDILRLLHNTVAATVGNIDLASS